MTNCMIITRIFTRQCYKTSYRHNFKGLSPETEKSCRTSYPLPAGLTGQFCEINTDDCEEKPCGVLSICKDTLNGYNCFCAPGFIGKWKLSWSYSLWVKVSFYTQEQCVNMLCAFHTFLGNSCEIEVNECLSQPCRNGGSCIDELNSFSCQCPVGITGILYASCHNCLLSRHCSETYIIPTYYQQGVI